MVANVKTSDLMAGLAAVTKPVMVQFVTDDVAPVPVGAVQAGVYLNTVKTIRYQCVSTGGQGPAPCVLGMITSQQVNCAI